MLLQRWCVCDILQGILLRICLPRRKCVFSALSCIRSTVLSPTWPSRNRSRVTGSVKAPRPRLQPCVLIGCIPCAKQIRCCDGRGNLARLMNSKWQERKARSERNGCKIGCENYMNLSVGIYGKYGRYRYPQNVKYRPDISVRPIIGRALHSGTKHTGILI